MKTYTRTLITIAALVLAAVFASFAQQQFSGGQTVTVGNASLAVTQSGNWAVRAQDGSGNGLTSTSNALDVNIKSGSIANTAFGLNAGTAKVGIVYPYTGCGTTAVEAKLQALPASATAIGAASDTCVLSIYLHNTSSSTAYTFTITDGQGSPVNFANAVTINPLEERQWNFQNGLKLTSGIKWNASNAAVTGAVEALQ